MRLAPFLLYCLISVPTPLVAAEQDPEELLLRIREKCVYTLARLPRYMCTETIDRDYFEPASHPESSSCDKILGARRRKEVTLQRTMSDRLRLNVATNSAEELYSWVGDRKFHDKGLFDLVDRGPLQTGTYMAFMTMIFQNNEASFFYIGEQIVEGRRVAEYGFRTPRERSRYHFGPSTQHVQVGYDGTFTADVRTLDLVRMVVRTAELPDTVQVCEASTTFDYQRVRLRDGEFLLPSQTQLHMVMANGDENHSRTAFSACHEFLGESTLKFDIAATTSDAETTPVESSHLVLPPGQAFTVTLLEGIDTGMAAAGDAVRGKLMVPIRSKRPKFEIPAGAPVQGRIVRLEHEHGKGGALTLVIKLETVEMNGVLMPFTAKVNHGPAAPVNSQSFKSRGRELGRLGDLSPRGVAVFHFANAGEHYLVKSGLESRWITLGR